MIYPFPFFSHYSQSWGWVGAETLCFLPTFICFFLSVKMTEEQWKKGLLQGLNNASAETNLRYFRILQQRPLSNESVVCLHVFLCTRIHPCIFSSNLPRESWHACVQQCFSHPHLCTIGKCPSHEEFPIRQPHCRSCGFTDFAQGHHVICEST